MIPMNRNAFVRTLVQALPLTAALVPAVAGAAGFEKALIWSAKNAGMGGAVSSFVSGAESTVWNPAGLAAGSGTEISGSFGPAFSTFTAPKISDSTTSMSSTSADVATVWCNGFS